MNIRLAIRLAATAHTPATSILAHEWNRVNSLCIGKIASSIFPHICSVDSSIFPHIRSVDWSTLLQICRVDWSSLTQICSVDLSSFLERLSILSGDTNRYSFRVTDSLRNVARQKAKKFSKSLKRYNFTPVG